VELKWLVEDAQALRDSKTFLDHFYPFFDDASRRLLASMAVQKKKDFCISTFLQTQLAIKPFSQTTAFGSSLAPVTDKQ